MNKLRITFSNHSLFLFILQLNEGGDASDENDTPPGAPPPNHNEAAAEVKGSSHTGNKQKE
jgi:hypothetical protein